MQPILSVIRHIEDGVRRDARVRWGVGAGASVLLSAGVLGMGGSLAPGLLHASAAPRSVIPLERIEDHGVEVVDMSTSTVSQVIEAMPKAERFELMLYNSGASDALKKRGTYTVFVPASADFDYLPKRYIASLSRADTYRLSLSHIVPQSLPMDESLNGTVVTLSGATADFEWDAASNALTVDGAKVDKAYKASNGWVYLIHRVLVPEE